MKQEAEAPKKNLPKDGQDSRFDQTMYQRNLYMVMVLNMTWQLAAAVLIPVVGGHYLDQYFGTAPMLLIIGGVVALLGVVGVMMRIVAQANRQTSDNTKNEGKK